VGRHRRGSPDPEALLDCWRHDRRKAAIAVSIRDGVAADHEAVVGIKIRSWAETYGPLIEAAVLREHLDPKRELAVLRGAAADSNTVLLVAVDPSRRIVGFSLAFPSHEPEPLLESLHVAREFQGRGVGELLLRATAGRIQARGHGSMRLAVIAGNTGAARFYERLGGTMAGLEPTGWADGVWHEVYRWPDISTLTRADAP
jgi:ribosomal protein S18 acetylase RimI-like enzyme